jgi:hypothetical protein
MFGELSEMENERNISFVMLPSVWMMPMGVRCETAGTGDGVVSPADALVAPEEKDSSLGRIAITTGLSGLLEEEVADGLVLRAPCQK